MKPLSKLFNWYFSRGAIPFWVIFIIDLLVVYGCAVSTYALNHGVTHIIANLSTILCTLGIYMVFYAVCFNRFHTYAGIVRYSSFVDLQRIVLAMGSALVASAVFKSIFANEHLFPVWFMDIITWSVWATILMMLVRIVVKYWFDSIYGIKETENIYIYGVREGGIALAKSIRGQKPAKFKLRGFVTNDADTARHTMMGEKVYLNDRKLIKRMADEHISGLFVSPLASEALREDTELVNELLQAGIKIYMMPQEQEWDTTDGLSHRQLHEVEIEDLLPRDIITVDLDEISQQLRGTTILVTGAAGSIGSEIAAQVASFGPGRLVLVDQAETPLHDLKLTMSQSYPNVKCEFVLGDIANYRKMRAVFQTHMPEYVFHAAAYKHVPMMEENPWESIHNNVVGTRNLADLSVEYGVSKFVMVSTDKAVKPTNVMGCSKRICEVYVQSLDRAVKSGEISGVTQFVTTRFGNVLGSNGSVIPLFRKQIKQGGPITITHPDIIRYFMLISEACKLVLEAGTKGKGGEIFVFDMGQPVKIVDLARRMIKLSGANIEISYIGLRPGEKLYEELLNDKEETVPCDFHDKINIAKVEEYDYAMVKSKIDEMQRHLSTDDNMAIVRRMKGLIPEYKSKNSVYEKIDREIEEKLEKISVV